MAMVGNKMRLTYANFETSRTSNFIELLKSQSFVDVTLSCEDHIIKAHKVILASNSSYFEFVFKNHPNTHPVIFLKDISWEHLKLLVKFMYQGTVDVSKKDLTTFLQHAKSLKINGLLSYCNKLQQKLSNSSGKKRAGHGSNRRKMKMESQEAEKRARLDESSEANPDNFETFVQTQGEDDGQIIYKEEQEHVVHQPQDSTGGNEEIDFSDLIVTPEQTEASDTSEKFALSQQNTYESPLKISGYKLPAKYDPHFTYSQHVAPKKLEINCKYCDCVLRINNESFFNAKRHLKVKHPDVTKDDPLLADNTKFSSFQLVTTETEDRVIV